jgi:hypothetical protein
MRSNYITCAINIEDQEPRPFALRTTLIKTHSITQVTSRTYLARQWYLKTKETPNPYSYLLNGFAYGFPPSTTTLAAFLTR